MNVRRTCGVGGASEHEYGGYAGAGDLLASAGFRQAAKIKIRPGAFVFMAEESMAAMRLRGITNDLRAPVAGRVSAWIGQSSLSVSIPAAEVGDLRFPAVDARARLASRLAGPLRKRPKPGLGTARTSQPARKRAFCMTPHTVVEIGFRDLLPVVPERLSRDMDTGQNYRFHASFNARAWDEKYAGPTLVVARNRESLNVPETRHGSSCQTLQEVLDCGNCSILTNGQQTSYRSRVEEPFGQTEKSL
jgi:hypothetical protein